MLQQSQVRQQVFKQACTRSTSVLLLAASAGTCTRFNDWNDSSASIAWNPVKELQTRRNCLLLLSVQAHQSKDLI